MRQERTIRFGSADVNVQAYQTRLSENNGHTEHDAILKIDGELNTIFMENEVIDLVSYEMGTNPLQCEIIERKAKKVGQNKFAIKWTTKKRGI